MWLCIGTIWRWIIWTSEQKETEISVFRQSTRNTTNWQTPPSHVYTAEVHNNNNTSGLTVITLITFLFTTYTSRLEEFELRNCTLLYFPLSPAFKQVTVVSWCFWCLCQFSVVFMISRLSSAFRGCLKTTTHCQVSNI